MARCRQSGLTSSTRAVSPLSHARTVPRMTPSASAIPDLLSPFRNRDAASSTRRTLDGLPGNTITGNVRSRLPHAKHRARRKRSRTGSSPQPDAHTQRFTHSLAHSRSCNPQRPQWHPFRSAVEPFAATARYVLRSHSSTCATHGLSATAGVCQDERRGRSISTRPRHLLAKQAEASAHGMTLSASVGYDRLSVVSRALWQELRFSE